MQKRRVLIVEDEPKLQALLQGYLEPEYEVLLAPDGHDGLTAARESRPDVVLLDLALPCLDGLSVLRTLKMNPDTVTIPVVIISATSSSESLLAAKALGALDYLIKPFELSDVRRTVRRAVQQHLSYPSGHY